MECSPYHLLRSLLGLADGEVLAISFIQDNARCHISASIPLDASSHRRRPPRRRRERKRCKSPLGRWDAAKEVAPRMPFPRLPPVKLRPRPSAALRLPARAQSFEEDDTQTPLATLSNLLFDCGCPNDTPPCPPHRFVTGTDTSSFPTQADLRKILEDLTEASSSEEPQHKVMAQSA